MKMRGLAVLLSAVLTAGALAGCQKTARYAPELPTGPETAEITVEKIDDLPAEFFRGVDVSTVLAQERSGVRYFGPDGEEQDLMRTLADAGVNCIRVRVWNDPYDGNGRGYGGGNCDVASAAEIGRRAAEYGLRLCVDFHYSDFWADPARQAAPKVWTGMRLEQKREALREFTLTALETISDAGGDIAMVQIGNEINNGLAGESRPEAVMTLLATASQAVRTFSGEHEGDLLVAVHYTDVHRPDGIRYYAGMLQDYGVDYDVFGVSYYPFWHGSMENLTEVLSWVRAQYGKQTVVLETSYPYTLADGDGFPNNVGAGDLVAGYPASVQGQADCLRDVMAAVWQAGGAGVFYWEPAWIPVGENAGANRTLWEEYGSGWASSFAAEYDPDNAGRYYGGSGWDNQALFDFTGKPLPSLNVFRYARYGAGPDV